MVLLKLQPNFTQLDWSVSNFESSYMYWQDDYSFIHPF